MIINRLRLLLTVVLHIGLVNNCRSQQPSVIEKIQFLKLDKVFEDFKYDYYLTSSNIDSNSFQGVIEKGLKLLENKKAYEAKETFRKLIDEGLDNYLTYYYLGVAYEELYKKDSAIICFDRSIQKDQFFTSSYLRKGKVQFSAGMMEEAEATFKKVSKISDEQGLINYNLGYIAYVSQNYPLAKQYLNDQSIDGELRLFCDLILLEMNKQDLSREEIIESYRNTIKKDTTYLLAQEMLYEYYLEIEEREHASMVVEDVLGMDPDNVKALFIRGYLKYLNDDNSGLDLIIQSTIKLKEKNTDLKKQGYGSREYFNIIFQIRDSIDLNDEVRNEHYKDALKFVLTGRGDYFDVFSKNDKETLLDKRIYLFYLNGQDKAVYDNFQLRYLLNLDSTDLNLLLLKNDLLIKAEKYHEAFANIQFTQSNYPENNHVKLQFARVLFELDSFNQAADRFNELLFIDPGNLYIHYMLANIHFELKELRKSISHYRIICMISPFYSYEPYLLLSKVYLTLYEKDSSLVMAKRCYIIYPDRRLVKLQYATALCENGRSNEGLVLINELMDQNDRKAEYYFERAIANAYLGNVKMATEDLDLLKYNNIINTAQRLYYVGISRKNSGNISKAMDFMEWSIRQDSLFNLPYAELGELHFNKGNHQEAIKWSELALSKNVESPIIVFNLALNYFSIGNIELAKKYFQEGIELCRTRESAEYYLAIEKLEKLVDEEVYKDEGIEILRLLKMN